MALATTFVSQAVLPPTGVPVAGKPIFQCSLDPVAR